MKPAEFQNQQTNPATLGWDYDINDYPPLINTLNDIFFCLYTRLSEIHDKEIFLRDFKSSWMTENPGKQLLSGSFEPLEITWEEWLRDACNPDLGVVYSIGGFEFAHEEGEG
jgi:hypothetical protein